MQAVGIKTALACILFGFSSLGPGGHFQADEGVSLRRDAGGHFATEFPRRDKNNPDKWYIGLNPMITPCFCLPFRSPFLNYLKVDANVIYDYLTKKEFDTDLFNTIIETRIKEVYPTLFPGNNEKHSN